MTELFRSDDNSKLFAIDLPYRCPVKWGGMKGDARVRHCAQCKQSVYNISLLTRDEAVDLISSKQGELCVRFFQRSDGTVVTRDCASILGRSRILPRSNILVRANAYCAALVVAILPVFGPAFISIQQGGSPPMMNSDSNERSSGKPIKIMSAQDSAVKKPQVSLTKSLQLSLNDYFNTLKGKWLK